MPLFEVAILEKPTEKAAKDGKSEVLVFGPKSVVAGSEEAAGIKAVLESDGDLKKLNLDRLEVLVRPFG